MSRKDSYKAKLLHLCKKYEWDNHFQSKHSIKSFSRSPDIVDLQRTKNNSSSQFENEYCREISKTNQYDISLPSNDLIDLSLLDSYTSSHSSLHSLSYDNNTNNNDTDDDEVVFIETPKKLSHPSLKSNRFPNKQLNTSLNPLSTSTSSSILATPTSKNKKSNIPFHTPVCTPTTSSKALRTNRLKKCTPLSVTSSSFRSHNRESRTKQLYDYFNKKAFKSLLPSHLSVIWNKRLCTTAGITRTTLINSQRCAEIELSVKVIDNDDRLQHTLLHEMCHAAAWLIDAVRKPPHGKCFWKWADMASKALPGVEVTTCHSFVVHTPYKFICTNEACGQVYGRHSKKGIDVEKHRCGHCHNSLKFQGVVNTDGTPRKIREVNGFSAFVKSNYSAAKAVIDKSAHKDVMAELSRQYKELKI